MIYQNLNLWIDSITVGPFGVNCYVIVNSQTQDCWLIDPGAEAEEITHWLQKKNLHPKTIIVTHGHGDHIGAVSELMKTYNSEFWCGEFEEEMLYNPLLNFSSHFGTPIVAPKSTRLLTHDEIIPFGFTSFQILNAPGHTVGEILLYSEGVLVCGDVLFAGSVGRTDLPGGNSKQLWNSIKNYVLPLPLHTVILPGHGPISDINRERNENPFLQNDGQLLLEC